jgi:glycosyltransferase involved in cell wall biosynthesis
MHQSDLEPAAGHDAPMVSVVITCFNYGEYLAEAIDSAIGQSYRPLEVIVVNDGSTDDTEAVAMQYAGDIHYLYQSNSGVSVARNTGIRTARGDFVVGLDADDTLAPDFVEKCVNLLQAHPTAGFVYTQARLFGRESGQTEYPEYDPVRLKQYNFIHQSVLIRAPVVKAHMYDENFTGGFEDWNFFLTLAEHEVHGILLDEPLLNYRKHTDRTSRLSTLTYHGRRSRLQVVKAHPDFYTTSEKFVATIKAASEPARVFAGRLKRRLKRRPV